MENKQEIKAWDVDQRLCDIANVILKVLVDNQTTVGEVLTILDKVNMVVDSSIRSTSWDGTLECGTAEQRSGCVFFKRIHEETEEINKRIRDSCGLP